MFTNRAAVAALATILMLAGGGFAFSRLTGAGPGGVSPTPSSTPIPSPSPTPGPTPSPTPLTSLTTSDVGRTLRPGTYIVDRYAAPFRITLPAGWTLIDLTRNNVTWRSSSNGFLTLVVVNAVYADPCHTESGPTPIGTSVDDLIGAFTSMTGFQVKDVSDVSIGGADGKAFSLSNSIDPNADGCSNPDVLAIGKDGSDADILFGGSEAESLWAVNDAEKIVLIGGPAAAVDTVEFDPTAQPSGSQAR